MGFPLLTLAWAFALLTLVRAFSLLASGKGLDNVLTE